jgi:hypothetical protein
MEAYLRGLGLSAPRLDHCKCLDDVAEVCSAEYMTEGLALLRTIPSASVDFVWSHAVLPYVRRGEFLAVMQELRAFSAQTGWARTVFPLKTSSAAS